MTALELLAWDRYRRIEPRDPSDRKEVEMLIAAGSGCHGRLLGAVHGEGDDRALAASKEWLRDSRAAWSKRPSMIEKGSFLRGDKLRLTEEDIARLDRVHPERSFSTGSSPADEDEPDDLVGRLERLGVMHREGLLTESEYAAAKAKLLAGSS